MALDPTTNTLYVALSHQVAPRVEAIAVITLVNDEVQSIRRVPITPTCSQPHDVAFNPVTKRLYVANLGALGAALTSVTIAFP